MPRRSLLIGLAVFLFAATIAYRFLTMGGQLGGFENDDFLSMANAQQLAMGERPIADYFEHGFPLQELLGAAAYTLLGPTLFSQFVVSVFFIALSTVLLFALGAQASGSMALAFALALIQIGLAPRYYNYPKLLAYGVALATLWAYIARPERRRLWLVAAAGVFAFLLRHDHGAYVGAAGILAVALVQRRQLSRLASEIAVLGGMALLLVSPYLIYVIVYQGPITYLQTSLLYGERQTVRTSADERPPLALDWTQPLVTVTPRVVTSARINVQWRAGLDEAARREREAVLGLAPDNLVRPDVWNYRLSSWTKPAVTAIVSDPLVVAIEGINRTTLEIEQPKLSRDRKSTCLNSSHVSESRMPSSA